MLTLRIDNALAGFERLRRRLVRIEHIADRAGPLMEHWERVIEDDNREGVLAGTDKDGHAAPPLRYRPTSRRIRVAIYGPRGGRLNSVITHVREPLPKLTVAQRLGQHHSKRRGIFAGHGPAASGLHNNLTSAEYRKLTGPRLAPRRQFSRVITNLLTGHGRNVDNPSVWYAEGAWFEVVNQKGEKFLHCHFDGEGNNPQYDLRGVRPGGVVKLKDSLVRWAKLEIRAG